MGHVTVNAFLCNRLGCQVVVGVVGVGHVVVVTVAIPMLKLPVLSPAYMVMLPTLLYVQCLIFLLPLYIKTETKTPFPYSMS